MADQCKGDVGLEATLGDDDAAAGLDADRDVNAAPGRRAAVGLGTDPDVFLPWLRFIWPHHKADDLPGHTPPGDEQARGAGHGQVRAIATLPRDDPWHAQ